MLLQIATSLVVFFLTLAAITVVVQQRHYMRAIVTFMLGALLFIIPVFFIIDLGLTILLYAAGGGLIAYAVVSTVKRLRLIEQRRLRAEILAEQQESPGPLDSALLGAAKGGTSLVSKAVGGLKSVLADAPPPSTRRAALPAPERRSVLAAPDDQRSLNAAARAIFRTAGRESPSVRVAALLAGRGKSEPLAITVPPAPPARKPPDAPAPRQAGGAPPAARPLPPIKPLPERAPAARATGDRPEPPAAGPRVRGTSYLARLARRRST